MEISSIAYLVVATVSELTGFQGMAAVLFCAIVALVYLKLRGKNGNQ